MSFRPPVKCARVLVLGDCRQTITVVRSLGRGGFEVTLGTEDRRSSAGLSRFVSDVWVYDNASPQRFCNNLEAFLRCERPDFVFTAGEWQLRRLAEMARRLEPLSTWVNPDFATVVRCYDKGAMQALAAALGIATGLSVPGVRHDCQVAAADGKLLACCAPQALRVHCEAITNELRYTGIGRIRFLVNEGSGDAAFIDFLPHMGGCAAVACRLARDYPLVAVQLAAYRAALAAGRTDAARLLPDPMPASHDEGRTLSGRLGFDWRDPLPTLHSFWRQYFEAPLPR
jgi:hypothetical protein